MTVDGVTPAFLVAGNEARVGTARWWGDVIIGADAIYIFQTTPARGRKYFVPFELLADRILPRQELPGSSYAAISDSVRNHPAWPVHEHVSCPVLVIPRNSVDFLHHQRGKLEMRLIFSGTEIAIPHGRFGAKKIKSFVEATGWPLIWDKEPLNIPQDSSLLSRVKTSAKCFRTPYISYATIASGFIIATLPMLLLLLPGLNQSLVSNLYMFGLLAGVSLIFFGWIASRRGL